MANLLLELVSIPKPRVSLLTMYLRCGRRFIHKIQEIQTLSRA